MRRPLVTVALLYVVGLLCAEAVQPDLSLLLALGGVLALLALGWSRARSWLLIAAIIVFGWANLISRTAVLSPHDLRSLVPTEPLDTAVRGKVVATPSVRMFMRDQQESFRTLALVEVTELRERGEWIPATGRIMTTTPGSLEGVLFGGTEVEVGGILATPPRPVAPGLFDYQSYLARQGVYFQLKAGSTNSWRALGEARPNFSDRFLAWSQRILERGLPEKDEPLRLLQAMTLGLQTGLDNDTYTPFVLSGTMHIFAISGLHIALIAGLLVVVMRVAQIPRQWCGLLVIPLIWFYTGATGWQPSAVRSTLMMSIIIGGWSLGRPSDLLNSLAAAGLIILVWEPQQLFQASFQLSFFVVLSIALLLPPLQKFGDKLLAHDPMLPREALPRWRRWLNTPLRWLMLSFATSLAAWLGSLPLTIYYFHILSPVTLLANLIVVPLSGFALACNMASLFCGDWLPWLGELFNHAGWFWMLCMARLSQISAGLPGAFRYVAAPPLWIFGAYYGLLIAALSGWLLKKEYRLWSASVVVLVALGLGWEWQRQRNTFELTVIPLNGGHTVHVDGPGRDHDLLVDCGDSNAVSFVTNPFLHARGVNTLPRLALTHGDLQHVGGTKLLWDELPVLKTLTSPIRFRSPAYRAIGDALETAPERHGVVARHHTNTCWTVLHPEESDRFPQADDASLVLLGEIHGTRILLLGDLGRPGQETLLQRHPNLHADIVVTGLPEQGEALSNGLIERLRPKLIVIADSEYPATKRASFALRGRLTRTHIPVLYTRTTGAVTVSIEPDGWRVQTMDGAAFDTRRQTL